MALEEWWGSDGRSGETQLDGGGSGLAVIVPSLEQRTRASPVKPRLPVVVPELLGGEASGPEPAEPGEDLLGAPRCAQAWARRGIRPGDLSCLPRASLMSSRRPPRLNSNLQAGDQMPIPALHSRRGASLGYVGLAERFARDIPFPPSRLVCQKMVCLDQPPRLRLTAHDQRA